MKPDDWARVRAVFERLVALGPSERAAALEELAGPDEELRREVESLLAAAPGAVDFLEQPVGLDRQLLTPSGGFPAVLPERIGPYRVLRQIGRGGMGRVFLAEQEGEEFRRQVALKVIDRPAAGPDLVRRFRDEVRILASLEHPRIARFLDGGRTSDGAWFLALEYVEGEDLLAFVRGRGLGLRERVALFLQVLDAIDFAHRRLVVHRDLKPGNVLVGADGQVKLLDFGISKIVDPETADAAATRTELRLLTPAYASPEQLRGERVTVAADIYSLGVVLYELLAGQRPFARLDSRPDAAERDPEPPSHAARKTTTGASTATAVRWRELSGDLDAIVLKALREEPESRYASAAALADDLRRWLDGRPVAARRGGRRYRLSKFAARHAVTLAAAAAVLVALAAGVSVALVQRARALAAQGRAEATVADLHRLTQSMLFDIYEEARLLPSSIRLSGKIALEATDALDRLAKTAGDDPGMLADLAEGYERLGALFAAHRALGASLDQPAAAVEHSARAVAIRERLAARPGAGFADRLALAKSLEGLARSRMSAGDEAGFVQLIDHVVDRLTALAEGAPDLAAVTYRLAVVHGRTELTARRSRTLQPLVGRHAEEAARHWLEFLTAPAASALAEDAFPAEVEVGARFLFTTGHAEEALRLTDLALAALDERGRDQGESLHAVRIRAGVLDQRADALRQLGRSPEALGAVQEVRRLRSTLPADADSLLSDLIRRHSLGVKTAALAGEVGDLELAANALAEAESYLTQLEERFGPRGFIAARIDLDWTRAGVLVSRAGKAPSSRERGRLLRNAVEILRAALERTDRLAAGGQAAHGLAPERVAAQRRLKEELEASLRNPPRR